VEVAGGEAPLIDPDDNDGWIDAVREIIDDRDAAEERAAAVRARAVARFSWPVAAAACRAIYELVDR
jgi:glycosyltransferase involved in cell wall biosynthesis